MHCDNAGGGKIFVFGMFVCIASSILVHNDDTVLMHKMIECCSHMCMSHCPRRVPHTLQIDEYEEFCAVRRPAQKSRNPMSNKSSMHIFMCVFVCVHCIFRIYCNKSQSVMLYKVHKRRAIGSSNHSI